jgi:hypothetical protein
LIGGNVDIDLLSFLSKIFKKHRRYGEEASSRRSIMEGKSKLKRWGPLGKKTPVSR